SLLDNGRNRMTKALRLEKGEISLETQFLRKGTLLMFEHEQTVPIRWRRRFLESFDAFDQRYADLIAATLRDHSAKFSGRMVPVPASHGSDALLVEREPRRPHVIAGFLEAEELENFDADGLAVNRDPSERAGHEVIARGQICALADDDFRAEELVERLETARYVHSVADHGVVEAIAAADVADDNFAGVEPHAGMDPRQLAFAPCLAQRGEPRLAGKCPSASEERVLVGRDWRSPEGHDRIADILVDRAALHLDFA